MLSIITVTKDNHDELIKTISSIPDFDFIEKVVINGGSDPGTKTYLEKSGILHLSEKDNGIADAFNKGINLSHGDLIMFLNSGDILINPDYLRRGHKLLHSSTDTVTESVTETAFVYSNLLFTDEIAGNLIVKKKFDNIGRGMKYSHPTMIVKRKVFDETGMFDGRYRIAMDYDFVVRLEKGGYRGLYIDGEPVVKMDGGGVSYVKEGEAIRQCYRVLRERNYLNIYTLWGFTVRYLLYKGRMFMKGAGLTSLLALLKQKKYSS